MKVGIIGSGGREHSICKILKRSNNVTGIYCFPGNAGTAQIANNIDINIDNYDKFKNFILDKKIDLVIVGPEKPLVDGIVNYLENLTLRYLGQIKRLLN
jgi:phosphoribosylamine--glycine ligase